MKLKVPLLADLRRDAVAGLPGAISSVPDGMAAGVLAGVNPVHGLYAAMAGPIGGGLSTDTRLMVITTTSAAALAAGSALADVPVADQADAVVLMALLAGGFMIVAGAARLGRYTRFVSHSVMLGFLTGIAVNIFFGQLADLAGAPAAGGTSVGKGLRVLLHPGRIDPASLAIGVGALILLIVAARTRWSSVGALVALAAPTAVVMLAGLDSVARVNDSGDVPRGLPVPGLPDLDVFSPSMLATAAAIAAIVLVQGAGVAEAAPNPDGPSRADRDFAAQGIGNLAAGVMSGMPVGGSVGQTALNVASGARSRWASIATGVWMAVILIAFARAVGEVATPTLAAVLILAAVGSLRPAEALAVLRAGRTSQVALAGTFVATLALPVATAVGVGVLISLLLQLNQDAVDLSVVELVVTENGGLVEQPPPASLTNGQTVVLDVYGSLFYAGARTLQARLPNPAGARDVAVVLRLRGRTTFGATFFKVVVDYVTSLDANGGRLYLTGLDPTVVSRLEAAPTPLTGAARLFVETPEIGASTRRALADARAWQVRLADAAD